MPTSSRRTRLSVIDQLLANPEAYSFSQVVRLLERAAVFANAERNKQLGGKVNSEQPISRFAPPTREVLRISGMQGMSFPHSEVRSIKPLSVDDDVQQWSILVNFMGLTGAMGVLPFHYSETILQRQKVKDRALGEFLNLFNHRTVSMFFQASNKYSLPIEYERAKLHNQRNEDSPHTKALLSILGLGTNNLRRRQKLQDESLIFYSGLLSQQVKTPSGLKQIVQDYFGVPAEIEGFIGQWQELIDDVRSRLGAKGSRKGQNVCLGRSAMLGKRGWFAQGKSRVKLGPLNKKQFETFAPGTGALKALNEIVRSYLGMEQDYDFVIEVKRDDIPNKIALEYDKPPTLAWNAWLSGKPKTNTDKDELLKILVSSKKLQ